MAVTKIWTIKDSLKCALDYAANPEKTTASDLEAVISYAMDGEKTANSDEQSCYVSGINCNSDTVFGEMMDIKKLFGKTVGNLAYHCYQSFRPGEVTAEECHAMGLELARRMWGDRYQVLVATHLDKDHLHSHIVINSVSFRDGKKFHDCRDTYSQLREASDRICLEHGLSIVDNPKGRGVDQYLYKMEKAGMPTRYNVARQAIDEAVALSLNIDEFKSELRRRGYNYRFDSQRKYWTVTPPGWKKSIRIHQLGPDYTRESIERRICENDPSVSTERIRQSYRMPNHYNLRRRIDRIMGRTGLEKLYLRYCYELGYLPKYRQNPTRLHIVLKEDLLKCDQYSEQAKLLSKYHVNTDEDLSLLMERIDMKMQELSSQRDERRLIAKRVLPVAETDKAREEAKELTREIRELRQEAKVCREVQDRSGHVRENLEIVDRDRQKEKER